MNVLDYEYIFHTGVFTDFKNTWFIDGKMTNVAWYITASLCLQKKPYVLGVGTQQIPDEQLKCI